ncbi:MAG: heme-copper oxidase subunit III [Gemmatimonadota bacterium]|nr:heme-copper oxidase subunit III [Gemmatimonadota bacterium]MDH3421925.1 heme-copper oxidase subunit III [Gemmatimonadota bacterium]
MSAQSAAYPIDQRPVPTKREPLVSNGVLGMLIFIFTEIMFFAGLISAHSIVRSQTAGQMWPPFGQPRLPVQETAVNTAALLVSGIVLVITWFAFRRERQSAKIPLLLSIVLGGFFVWFQGIEWMALLQEGLTIQSSSYGGFFYLIIGTHAVHAIAALVALVWALMRLNNDQLVASQLATVSAFWYFVVLVWPVLYVKVYL